MNFFRGGVFQWHTISVINASVAELEQLIVLHLASLTTAVYSKLMRQSASSAELAHPTVL